MSAAPSTWPASSRSRVSKWVASLGNRDVMSQRESFEAQGLLCFAGCASRHLEKRQRGVLR